ncbi:MAG: hypothetical protein P8Y37_02320 [Anaerolineales bacterium]
MGWFNRSKIFGLFGVIFLAGLISGCSSTAQEKLWVKSESWSRAVRLGETHLVAPVPSTVSPSGEVISMLFPRIEGREDKYQPEIVLLSEKGLIQDRILVDLEVSRPVDASIQLNNGHLDKTPEGYVISYSGSREHPGVFLLLGDLEHLERVELDSLGLRVNQYVDDLGQLHLGWIRYPLNYGVFEIYYLQSDLNDVNPQYKALIHSQNITTAIRITGPALGFDQELAYFIWSESIVSGLDTGAQTTYLQYFPVGQPDKVRPPMRMAIPATQVLDEEPIYGTYFQVGNRVSMGGAFPRTTFLDNISILPGSVLR